jgi:hypothetical protein
MSIPSVSASSSVATDHKYNGSLSNTAYQVFSGRGNLYGFFVEENSGVDLFIQFFDAASTGDVTVGSTTPAFTFRIPANSVMGKDVNDSPMHFFAKGCVVAVTTSRTGAGAPLSPAVAQFWAYNSKY